jgi:hypothetical protein
VRVVTINGAGSSTTSGGGSLFVTFSLTHRESSSRTARVLCWNRVSPRLPDSRCWQASDNVEYFAFGEVTPMFAHRPPDRSSTWQEP